MRKTILAVSLLTLFAACEKIVEVDLPSSEPLLVVKGQITNEFKPWEIQLDLSQPYFDQDTVDHVTTAIVSITGTDGQNQTLNHQGQGLYSTADSVQCVAGETYTLNIVYEGKAYEASEIMPNGFPIDLILSYYLPNSNGFIEEGYYVFIKGDENPYLGDSYLWNMYVNDTLRDEFGYLLENDEFGDVTFLNPNIDPDDPLAGLADNILPRPFPFNVELGDSIVIEQFNLTPSFYTYLINLQTQLSRTGSPFDSPPANLNDNISNGGLGYFSVAHRVENKITIEE